VSTGAPEIRRLSASRQADCGLCPPERKPIGRIIRVDLDPDLGADRIIYFCDLQDLSAAVLDSWTQSGAAIAARNGDGAIAGTHPAYDLAQSQAHWPPGRQSPGFARETPPGQREDLGEFFGTVIPGGPFVGYNDCVRALESDSDSTRASVPVSPIKSV